MTAKVLNGCRRAPTALAVSRLENLLGCSIEPTFRSFLELSNGGVPRQSTYRDTLRTFFVQVFFPLDDDVEPNIFQRTTYLNLPRFHAHIGMIGAGDLLLVDAEGGGISGMFEGEVEYLADDIWQFVSRFEGELKPEDDQVRQMACSGDVERLRRFLREGNSINSKALAGRTIVQIAAVRGDLRMVKECYDHGASMEGVAEALKRVARFSFLEKLKEAGVLPEHGAEDRISIR